MGYLKLFIFVVTTYLVWGCSRAGNYPFSKHTNNNPQGYSPTSNNEYYDGDSYYSNARSSIKNRTYSGNNYGKNQVEYQDSDSYYSNVYVDNHHGKQVPHNRHFEDGHEYTDSDSYYSNLNAEKSSRHNGISDMEGKVVIYVPVVVDNKNNNTKKQMNEEYSH